MNHTSVERKLKTDIIQKNIVRKQLEKKMSQIARYTHQREKATSNRWRKRYATTVNRFQGEIAELREQLSPLNADLEARIKAEMEFSEEEIEAFRSQYQQEYAEMIAARQRAEAIRSDLEETQSEESPAGESTDTASDSEASEEIHQKEAELARAERVMKEEEKDVEEVQREIESEEKDKVFFTRELRRIIAEREIYG
ncbi:MAG: hypothetical protein H8D67_28530 [Deltaproteobacteria bacterium]|nr:hypothetical protein [Deltaproteobacteria bacterium]